MKGLGGGGQFAGQAVFALQTAGLRDRVCNRLEQSGSLILSLTKLSKNSNLAPFESP